MIVDQAVYRDGSRQPCTDLRADLASLAQVPHGFIWIGLKDPTQEEFADVGAALNLHPLAVEDAVEGRQRAKIERYGDTLFVVLKTLSYTEETSQVETGEVMLFVAEHFVLTVRRGDLAGLREIRQDVDTHPEEMRRGPISVLYKVMDGIVDTYQQIDTSLAEDLVDLEQDVFSPDRSADVGAIYSLKREVLETRRAAQPLVEPMTRLMLGEHLDADSRPFFRDIHDHLLRVVDHVDSYDRLLTDVLNAHLAQVSVAQNEDMRKISAWAAIIAVPTLIAGVYGMNFEFMPELSASFDVGGREIYYGYFVALAVMAIAAGVLHRAFRRSGWL
ncbi:magnesium/cobalt transporter CorA [Dermacoccaceae bacterium W4C1]